ncbi:hypothetical protein [Ktedonobacter sp. SOSP1-52]|uniref:hypothetical protein n=1 Tax=Ktedonobacter sp. SOSP1-52 TaxID=2778366 RepID=UPI0019156173|nr:hypothetical protein [Ktedonobacter sp. SOSP1-52]
MEEAAGTEEKGSYRLRNTGSKHGQEIQEAPHEHLYRLAMGSPIIRWCERCGASYLLQQRQASDGEPINSIWVAIEEGA